jgi:hypothetical protein
MKKGVAIVAISGVVIALMTVSAQAKTYEKWEDVLRAHVPVNVYVEKVANMSGNDKISEEKSTGVVKEMFSDRITPKFNVVDSRDKADIVFKGAVTEYVWMKKAPITDIYGAGALAMDLATRGKKNYSRKTIKYSIYASEDNKELLEGTALVTLKQAGMPEDESYEMMYERGGNMLAKNIFRKGSRGGRNSLRP